MANATYLKFSPEIKGNGTGTHAGWIVVDSYFMEQQRPGVTGGGGHGGGRVHVNQIKVTKRIDAASPRLFTASMKGERFATAILDTPGVKFVMTRVYVAHVSRPDAHTGENDLPTELITLDFETIEPSYNPQ